jgi:hypothetical protein
MSLKLDVYETSGRLTVQGRNHVVKLLLAKWENAQNRPQSPWWRDMVSSLWKIAKSGWRGVWPAS